MANRFLAALAYGLESRLTQALDVAAVSDPWAAIEQSLAPVVGSAAPATGAAVQEITEPGPDIETGQLEKGFGDRLVMGVVSEPIFAGDPSQDEPVQGYLLNCPLAAVLCAMAHTPLGRKRIRGMVRRRAGAVRSSRRRRATEYFTNDVPATLPELGPFEIDHSYEVDLAPAAAVDDSQKTWIQVTNVLHQDSDFANAIHYMSATSGALWPALIEKAHAVRSPQNSYDALRASLTPLGVMRDFNGSARMEFLNPATAATGGGTAATAKKVKKMLHRHANLPTVLGSLSGEDGEPAPAAPVIADHAYAVVDFDGTTVTLIEAQERTPSSRRVEVAFAGLEDNFGEIVQAVP